MAEILLKVAGFFFNTINQTKPNPHEVLRFLDISQLSSMFSSPNKTWQLITIKLITAKTADKCQLITLRQETLAIFPHFLCILQMQVLFEGIFHSCTSASGLVYSVYCHFQQYFSYIMAVSFIDGGNLTTWRKPPTCCKSLTNFIT